MGKSLDGFELSIRIPPELPEINIDFVLFMKALTNILDNAVKYSPPGTPIEIAGGRNTSAFRYVPSTERAQTELGTRVTVSLEKAVRRTCEWHCRMHAAGAKA